MRLKSYKKTKKIIGLILLGFTVIIVLINHYLVADNYYSNILSFSSIIIFLSGLLLVIPWDMIPLVIFDIREDKANKSIESIVEKIRLRAILFNNISVGIFIFTLIVILIGFYLLVFPPIEAATTDKSFLSTSLTIRIGASVLLIFLVQILFRVFKYLLRVAAFYNAKADAIEFNKFNPKLDLERLMELFTPDKYDISDLQQTSISDNFIDLIKAKLGK